MAALPIKITAAGYAALRNAQGNGTNAVIVAAAGLSSTAFAPGAAVPNELKRVATIAGGATAADTIHVTISDTGTDVYSLRGFGLYLTDGTLLGSYGQADVIVEKSGQAAMLLAVDIQFADIDATQITFGDTNFSNPQATTERMGVVELATDDETTTGTDSTRAITPKSLLAALNARLGAGAPSAFVKTLLAAATALAFRTALGVKSAATFDTGADNGLDADKLDGQHGSYYQAWANLTGVPASFPPGAHTHAAGDITSGVFPVVRGGTGVATVPAGSFLVGAGNGTDPLVPRTPAQVLTDIAAAPKSHSHIIDNVTGLQDALDGKAAKVHTHVITDVTGLQPALDGKLSLTGGGLTGPLAIGTTGHAVFTLAKAAGAYGNVFQGNVVSKARWTFVLGNSDAETGGNVGSNTTLDRFDDTGASIGTAFKVFRSTGNAYFFNNLGLGKQFTTDSAGGVLDLRTGAGGVIFRTASFDGTNTSAVIDGVTDNNGAFSDINMRAVNFNVITTAGSRMIVRSNNGLAIDSVNVPNNAFAPMSMTATSFTFAGGNISVAGAITAAGGFQFSDRRLKKNIRRRGVFRGLALRLARKFSEWDLKDGGRHAVGHIAQDIVKIAPWHTSRGEDKRKLLAIDNAGLALESSLDNALSIEDHAKQLAALSRRLTHLERKNA